MFDFANANAFSYYILLVGCFTCDVSLLSCAFLFITPFVCCFGISGCRCNSFHFRESAPSILAVARFFRFGGRTLSK